MVQNIPIWPAIGSLLLVFASLQSQAGCYAVGVLCVWVFLYKAAEKCVCNPGCYADRVEHYAVCASLKDMSQAGCYVVSTEHCASNDADDAAN